MKPPAVSRNKSVKSLPEHHLRVPNNLEKDIITRKNPQILPQQKYHNNLSAHVAPDTTFLTSLT